MNLNLAGKVMIITGATSGMGKSMAYKFAEEGASLMLSGRSVERGKALEADLIKKGAQVVFLNGDVTDIHYNQALVSAAIDHFGVLNGIITNAGVLGLGSITEIGPQEWHRTFEINVHSVYYLLKYAIPELVKSKKGVVVINASIAAFKSFPNHPAYCASKAALVALAKQAALDYGPAIRFNTVCPGPVDTPFIWDSAKAFPDPENAVSNAGKATLLKRLGQPQDIANLALFLASDHASWITGSSFTIDGGILANS